MTDFTRRRFLRSIVLSGLGTSVFAILLKPRAAPPSQSASRGQTWVLAETDI